LRFLLLWPVFPHQALGDRAGQPELLFELVLAGSGLSRRDLFRGKIQTVMPAPATFFQDIEGQRFLVFVNPLPAR
jgi:hypothetical protein